MVGPVAVGGLLSVFGPRVGLAAGGALFLAAVLAVTHGYLLRVHGRAQTARAWRTALRPAFAA
jgi:hypothetical protein